MWSGVSSRPTRQPVWIAAVVLGAALARSPSAAAHANGIVVDSCTGCHGGGTGTTDVTVTADRATFNPGDLVTFTLTIKWSSIRVGGAFITTGGVGTLQALAGEGLAVNAQGLTHTAPKAAVAGAVTFRFGWQAPSKPGAVDVQVAALAGNGNNASTGDVPGAGEFQWVFGCAATSFYRDLDRDGYGAKNLGVRLGCLGDPAPTGFATTDGDCDENNEMVHPGAAEVCNLRDDDCNGQIDENAQPVMMWPDGDGDGYYGVAAGTPKLGCGNTPGYATRAGDCDDRDAAIHPGATEICNNKDDNCDGQVDERVRPVCGVGWCARYSPSCDPADCRPGPPAVETCNFFDDDCDGEADNGACPAGMVCSGDSCVSTGSGPGVAGAAGAPASGGSSGSSGGGAGSSGASSASGGSGSPATGGTGGAAPPPSPSGCAVAASSYGPPTDQRRAECSWNTALAAGLGLVLRRRARRGRRRP
jgi:uncharacterized membrane protein YgcG